MGISSFASGNELGAIGSGLSTLQPASRSRRRVLGGFALGVQRAISENSGRMVGLSKDLKSMADVNMDQAMARRRAREAFIPIHQGLDHCLFKMDSRGIRTEESYERNSRGLEIFWKSWLPGAGVSMKGTVFFCHGYGDTCTFFFEGIAKCIAEAGYGVFAMDYPAFGLSEGLHGYIPSFDNIVDDVIEHYSKIKRRPDVKDLPHFIFGQSMGGAVALNVSLKQPQTWDGVILVAPMCKIAEDVTPPGVVLAILNLMSKVLPEAKLFPQKDLAELAFRDLGKRKIAEYNVISYKDQMRLKTAVELLKTTKGIESQVDKVSAPLLVLHGAADKVTDPNVSKFLYERSRSKDKTLKLYDDSYHCILEGEPDERIFEVINDMISWLDSHCVSKV
ncbi:caffeoylshikimate esterase [Amborella trichopoda]|uniref:Serine aminopeptidase S33 domain-containing protein n=1 Tax=Amborella trichopoda TaxID=13333 RepID=W1P8P3_AMBTC|nr:caffeoylshikimate esterase [Amborella trichopoda]ERN03976.1 hypothetical protein AMTR_s00079p00114930 [Amborella trichopoda]|eukprot:XP_006842301.1 caffeoylshikimate esterase [Amborella trichopoda]